MIHPLRNAVLGLLLLAFGSLQAAAGETLPPVIVGYYPSWGSNLPVGKIAFAPFTHLIHAFVTLRKGALRTSRNLPGADLTRAAHAAGVKVLLGLGGADSGAELAALTRNPAAEDACIGRLVRLVTENGYDGVDLDWEFPAEADAEHVVAFVAKLRQALRQANPRALLTMPLPWADPDGKYFDGPRLAPLLDFVQLMTYNAHGPWKADGTAYCHAGFNSPLRETATDPVDGSRYSYQKAVDYWRAKGFADSQLVIGLHLFGHGFMVEKWGETPLQPSPHGDIDYRKIEPLLAAGWQRKWDDAAGVPWLQSPPGAPAELITYDDPQSAELKGKWAKEAGLRGLFFWEISADFIDGRNVLVEAARKGFGLSAPR